LDDVGPSRASWLTTGESRSLRPSDRQLLEALRAHGELDRTELARLSGMPRSTVTDSIARLQQHGLIDERTMPASARSRAGRPPSLLALAPPSGLAALLWLTHESLHAGALGFDGTLHALESLDPYPYDATDRVAGPGTELLGRALQQAGRTTSELRCLVVVLPMPVSQGASGTSVRGRGVTPVVMRSSLVGPHMPADPAWEMGQALGIPAWSENDANLAALGEGALGAGTQMPSFIYVKIVQGIGAGLILDRRLHRGANGLAGELAHLHIDENGSVCACGGRGCLMTTFNARRLVDRIRAVHPAAKSMADVVALAASGDAGVSRLLRDLGRTIGRSLADFSVYVAPDGVVIDGVLQNAAAPVIDGIREAMYQFAPPAIASQVRVVMGALADRAEPLGAAVLARRMLFGHDLLSRPGRQPADR
jgi:predicted NBD/HSP70 family sugar kinase/DNA-binding transcriptional ArsR family regulator